MHQSTFSYRMTDIPFYILKMINDSSQLINMGYHLCGFPYSTERGEMTIGRQMML